MAFALESLFPEYVLNDDDKHGPSTISEEDADDEEKKVQASQALSPTVREGERKVLVFESLDSIDFTTQSAVKYCHRLSSCLVRDHMDGSQQAPTSVLRVSRTSSQQGWCHFGHVLDHGAIRSAVWLQDAQQRWSSYRTSTPHPLGDTRWPRPMKRIVAFNSQRGVQCSTCARFLALTTIAFLQTFRNP